MTNTSFVLGLIILLTSTLSETKTNKTSSNRLTKGINDKAVENNKVKEQNVTFNSRLNKSEIKPEETAKHNSSKSGGEKVAKLLSIFATNKTVNGTKFKETFQNVSKQHKTNQNVTNQHKTIQNVTNKDAIYSNSSTQSTTQKTNRNSTQMAKSQNGPTIQVNNRIMVMDDYIDEKSSKNEPMKKTNDKKKETKTRKKPNKSSTNSTTSNNRMSKTKAPQSKSDEKRAGFVEELELVDSSDFDIDPKSVAPPLEDSELDLLPKDFLSELQSKEESMDNSKKKNRQRIVPVFGGSRNAMGSKNRGAKSDPRFKWSNCQVPFQISNEYSAEERAIIKSSMTQFTKETGIKWVNKDANTKDFVAIQKGRGCSSPVGRQGGAQILSLGNNYGNGLK